MKKVIIEFELPEILVNQYLNVFEQRFNIRPGGENIIYLIRVDSPVKQSMLDMMVAQAKIQQAVDEQTAEKISQDAKYTDQVKEDFRNAFPGMIDNFDETLKQK